MRTVHKRPVSTVQQYMFCNSCYCAPGYNALANITLIFQIPDYAPIHCAHYLCGYSALAYNAFQDVTLAISGSRTNIKHVK